MYKVRLTFEKSGYAKYVSHLDLMRMFQRAFMRSELPISFSQGFNPHQKISIAFPLPLGVTGEKEYMDIELDEQIEFGKLISRLNDALPTDIKVSNASFPTQKTSLLSRAVYTVEIDLKNDISNLHEKIENVLNQNEIVVEKKTKKGISETDIKPSIISFSVLNSDNRKIVLKLVLSCADGASLKASVVVDALKKYIPQFDVDCMKIHRNGLFLENMTEIL
ncbi:MAG: TIGR03936 family radical SAM-associated protein [Clostridia bacterium]|nr:TIGR03936 family radical SAM-associated protein [Clostridia bacterium]